MKLDHILSTFGEACRAEDRALASAMLRELAASFRAASLRKTPRFAELDRTMAQIVDALFDDVAQGVHLDHAALLCRTYVTAWASASRGVVAVEALFVAAPREADQG